MDERWSNSSEEIYDSQVVGTYDITKDAVMKDWMKASKLDW